MKQARSIIIAAVTSMALATASQAELDSVGYQVVDNGIDGLLTIQFWAQFTEDDDVIEAVFGNSEMPLSLDVRLLWNNDADTGLPIDDTPLIDQGYDSWVGFVGDSATIAPSFTPDFMGVPGGGVTTSVFVDGISTISDDNSAYFIAGGATAGSIDSGNKVIFAQFSYERVAGSFSGGLQYNQGTQMYFDFFWHIPGPSALPVLLLAGVSRRRRG